jgi:HlyD family secretion protein
LPVLSSLMASCLGPSPLAVGYVEGSYVLVSPIEVAHVMSVEAYRGDRFEPGQPLVQLERRDREIAVAEAEAALAKAESQLADLRIGKRPEEIAAIEATLSSARAQEDEARRTVERQSDLLRRGAVAQATYDASATALAQARAKVLELEAQLAVAKLPARPEAIKAAEASVKQAQASLKQAHWLLDQRTLSISRPGTVFDVIRNSGELCGVRAGVHPTGDLLAAEPAEAGLPCGGNT